MGVVLAALIGGCGGSRGGERDAAEEPTTAGAERPADQDLPEPSGPEALADGNETHVTPTVGAPAVPESTTDPTADPTTEARHEPPEEPTEGESSVGDTGQEALENGEEQAAAEEARQRALVRRGRRVYNRSCDFCHPGGGEDMGPRVRGLRWPASRMRAQIRQGSGRMRPIGPSKVSNTQMESLLAYLRAIRAVR